MTKAVLYWQPRSRLSCNALWPLAPFTKHGLEETEASIANKLGRGTFPATFFLATIAALELEGIRLEDL
jgi:hypothetical protein